MDNSTTKARSLLQERLNEIGQEERRIRSALTALEGKSKSKSTSRATRKKTSRPRRGQSRADQFVKHVNETPGATVAQIAKVMHVQPNYLYRVAADLTKAHRITKRGKGYAPVATPTAK